MLAGFVSRADKLLKAMQLTGQRRTQAQGRPKKKALPSRYASGKDTLAQLGISHNQSSAAWKKAGQPRKVSSSHKEDTSQMLIWATEITVRAERRAGELLKAMQATKQVRGRGKPRKILSQGGDNIKTLAQLDISRRQSSAWQRVANLTPEKFQAVQLGEDAIAYAHDIQLEALRLLGTMLKETKRNTGLKGSKVTGAKREPVKDPTPTLADLGLDKKTSMLAQPSCARCGGFLVSYDFQDAAPPCPASRCLQCGDVTDTVILAHRQHRPEPSRDDHASAYDQEK